MSPKTRRESFGTAPSGKTAGRTLPAGKLPALSEGDRAPAFSLPRDGGGSVSLSDFAGRKLVIFFYPRAGTQGCTVEAKDFSRLARKFSDANTGLLGISADSVRALDLFRKKNLLNIPLASDEEHNVLKAYGVWDRKSMYGKVFDGIVRTTFLIDETGSVSHIWKKVKVVGHAEGVLSQVK